MWKDLTRDRTPPRMKLQRECFHFRVYVAHAQREAALVLDPAHCFLRLLKLVRSSLFVIFVHLRARLFLLALLKSLELRGALGGLKNP